MVYASDEIYGMYRSDFDAKVHGYVVLYRQTTEVIFFLILYYKLKLSYFLRNKIYKNSLKDKKV